MVIIGPSGSGKSTLLRCINKLEEITSGDLIVDGLKVNDPKVDERLIRQEAGMVFQQFYLFPHLTALETSCLARYACVARTKKRRKNGT
ncbi:GlnQ protein, subunit of glutamine ABC transporter [Escherichia coli]|uniref:GlnQ protein, subunit of glutamine ABC transporter n=1 Tax=Escherichia coli TaxID=562 RepID=A0A376YBQ0_ECOLX|nr:GlnQ protein, subunit of glutamine ABC transporter [Escherichia coli]